MQPAQSFDTVFTLATGTNRARSRPPFWPRSLKVRTVHPMLPNGVTAFVITNPIRFPTVDAWNFTIQRQVGQNMSVEAPTSGPKARTFSPAPAATTIRIRPTSMASVRSRTNQRKPFFQKFGWRQNLRYYGSDASNNYHSLQMKFDKRFANGLSSDVALHVVEEYRLRRHVLPARRQACARAASNNRAHVFFVDRCMSSRSGRPTVDVGWPESPSTCCWRLAVEWHVQLDGGAPFTPSYRDCNADRDTGWCRPDLVGDPTRRPDQFGWFTTTMPADRQRPGGRALGSARSAVISERSAGTCSSDRPSRRWTMSFFKTFAITERIHVQFRAESFNFANHTNLANPNGCVDCPGVAGRIFGAFANYVPRQWQMALKLAF